MITKELFSYVESERARNIPDSAIKSSLAANGWSEKDIAEAMSTGNHLGIMSQSTSFVSVKEQNKNTIWITFLVLLGVDVLLISLFKLFSGTWGLFGLSPLSILARVLIIYLIASFTSRGSSTEGSAIARAFKMVLRVFAAVMVVIIIMIGALYVYCVFAFSNYK